MSRSKSVQAFNTIGCDYNIPTRDHKYEIKYGLKFGDFGVKPRPSGYMHAIEKRARSVIDPQKYTQQFDWKKRSKEMPNYVIPKAKRITLADQMILDKKRIPGPPHYKDLDKLKPKVKGFYSNTETKCSMSGSIAFEKKFIPGPNMYESRGKGMSVILKEKSKAFLYVHKPDYSKTSCKIRKTSAPAPTSYEVGEAVDKTAQQRDSIKNSIPHDEKQKYISKCSSYTF